MHGNLTSVIFQLRMSEAAKFSGGHRDAKENVSALAIFQLSLFTSKQVKLKFDRLVLTTRTIKDHTYER